MMQMRVEFIVADTVSPFTGRAIVRGTVHCALLELCPLIGTDIEAVDWDGLLKVGDWCTIRAGEYASQARWFAFPVHRRRCNVNNPACLQPTQPT